MFDNKVSNIMGLTIALSSHNTWRDLVGSGRLSQLEDMMVVECWERGICQGI